MAILIFKFTFQVKVWFQNRRTKHKRVVHDGEENPSGQDDEREDEIEDEDDEGSERPLDEDIEESLDECNRRRLEDCDRRRLDVVVGREDLGRDKESSQTIVDDSDSGSRRRRSSGDSSMEVNEPTNHIDDPTRDVKPSVAGLMMNHGSNPAYITTALMNTNPKAQHHLGDPSIPLSIQSIHLNNLNSSLGHPHLPIGVNPSPMGRPAHMLDPVEGHRQEHLPMPISTDGHSQPGSPALALTVQRMTHCNSSN